jgi:hypothetical protein
VDELYVVARGVLLDALEALGPHRQAVVLVGAQAIYLRVGEADLAVAPYTTDGDLAVDPSVLSTIPPLEQALANGGFLPKSNSSVGIWVTHRSTSTSPSTEVAVDLLVPQTDCVEPDQSTIAEGRRRLAKSYPTFTDEMLTTWLASVHRRGGQARADRGRRGGFGLCTIGREAGERSALSVVLFFPSGDDAVFKKYPETESVFRELPVFVREFHFAA